MLRIKEGLLQETNSFVFLGQTRTSYKLYAEDGYCFYDKTEDIHDENSNSPQRTYMRFIIIPPSKDINDFVVVKIMDDFELVN